jgi:sulfofructose kinase
MPATVIAIGTTTLDRISFIERLPTSGTKVRAIDYLEVGGGQAATAAVAIARLGAHAILWGAVGDDPAAGTIVGELRREGVDTSMIAHVTGARSITSSVLVERSGERTIIADFDPHLYTAEPPRQFDPAAIAKADALLSDTKWPAAQEPALLAARARGVPTVLDIEPVPAGHNDRLVPLADHAIFGRLGLASYTGTDDIEEGLRIARRRVPQAVQVGVTLGAGGARFLTDAGLHHVPALSVDAVDTTGAGDAFHGAYALAIAEGRPPEQAASFATIVAGLKCGRAGGRAGLPTRAEVAAHER